MASDAEISQPGATGEKHVHLHLMLSGFQIIDQFSGYFDFGDRELLEFQPRHSSLINAAWRHHWNSEKLIVDGSEIEPGRIQFAPAKDREHMELSVARHDGLVVYLLEEVFWPLVKAVLRNDIEEATLVMTAEPWPDHKPFRLVFGNLSVVHRNSVRTVPSSRY